MKLKNKKLVRTSKQRMTAVSRIVCLLPFFISINHAQSLTKPTPAHLRFYEDNLAAMITFNMQTFVPQSQRNCCNTWNPDIFNPYLLNTDIWLQAAQSFGAKYAVLVCDHFSGFSMYPTSQHNYSVKYSLWKNGTGNVIKSFVESAYKYNIRPAIFYSVHENWYYNVSNFNISNDPNNPQQIAFENMAMAQLQEIVSIYKQFGSKQVAEIWFDAGVKQSLSFINRVNQFIIDNTDQINSATCHSCGAMENTSNVHWMGNEQAIMPYPNWGANSVNCGKFLNADKFQKCFYVQKFRGKEITVPNFFGF